jgi:beta-lactamase superfamily II metal-dependent hydrolase
MFELLSLQAEHGDALLVRYGDHVAPHYIMVDDGPSGTHHAIIEALDAWRAHRDILRLETLVVTHYDLDHIEGVIDLLNNKPKWLEINDIWFNGLDHLGPADLMGPAEGDELSKLIASAKYPWNIAFGGNAVKVAAAVSVSLAGGMEVWVLSPSQPQLYEVARQWRSGKLQPRDNDNAKPRDLLGRKDTWPPGDFSSLANTKSTADSSIPNGSSIALMLKFAGKHLLLAGDAFADVVENGLQLHWKSTPEVEMCKISHHGSQANTTATLLKAMRCRRFLISTSGKIHKHPDNVLIARLLALAHKPEIVFNYLQKQTAGWQTAPKGWPVFTATYPRTGEAFVRVDLMVEAGTG